MTRGHALPSSIHLADFHAFYDKAVFNKDGTVTITLKAPVEMKEHVVALSRNDGMALNISVWETQLDEGMQALARAVGYALPEP